MKKLTTIALIGASALSLTAGSVAAQGRWDADGGRYWSELDARQAQIDRRIDRGLRTGRITRQEAMRLRAEFRQVARLERRYRSDGHLSYSERADLDRRFDRLEMAVRHEARDRNYGYGYGHGYRD